MNHRPLSEELLAQDGRYQHAMRQAPGIRINTSGGLYSFGPARRSPVAFWAGVIAVAAVVLAGLAWGAA